MNEGFDHMTVVVTDLANKRPVTLKVASDSQMHKLPAMFAQRIAMRLKGGAAPPTGGSAAAGTSAGGAAGNEGGGAAQATENIGAER